MFPGQVFALTEVEELRYQKGGCNEDGSGLLSLDMLTKRSEMGASGMCHPVAASRKK